MQTLKKPIVIILVVLFIAGIIVFRLLKDDETEQLTAETPGTEAGQVVGADLIVLLKDLKSLNIDSAFFADTVFKRLKDFSVKLELSPGLVRRPNPFAPIGQDIDFVVSEEPSAAAPESPPENTEL